MSQDRLSTPAAPPEARRTRGAAPGVHRASRREAQVRETRARLLDAGRQLFAERGVGEVTTHSIAEAAGYASGTFYLHFKDKHALFAEIAEEAVQELESRLIAVSASKTEVEDIAYGQADALVSFADERRDLLRIVFHPGGDAADLRERILQRLAAGVRQRRQERAAEIGNDPAFDPDVIAQAIVGMWARVLAWWSEDPSRASREDLIRTLTHFQLYGHRHESADLCGTDGDPSDESNAPD